MADNTISSRLELDGEKEYKAALNDAYRELRVLRSELKAETAELGKNASEQDKARAKIKSLQNQIKEQEKIVQTLTKAFEESKKEYADHQEVQDKWEEKLNKARAALAEMKNQLEDSEDALQNFTRNMEEVSDGSGEAMQTVISFNDCLRSIGSIVSGVGSSLSGIFSASVETMKEMVSEMWELMGQAYAAAANWKDLQAMYGGNVEDIQAVFRGASLAGVDVGTITSGIEKLTQNTHAGNADTLAALEQLHIEESQYNSHWDYFIDVMDQLSMRKNGTELAGKIFGDKKGFGINLLLDQWKDLKDMYQQDIQETGLDLSAPEINALDEVERKIGEIQGLWNEIKLSIGAKLSEILNMDQLSDDTLAVLRDIGAIFAGDGDKKELTVKLENDLTKLLTDFAEGLGNLGDTFAETGAALAESDNPFVALIGQILQKLGGILDWIGENGDRIIAWLDKILPIVGANMISEATTGKGLGEWASDTVDTAINLGLISRLFKGTTAAGAGATAAGAGVGGGTLGTFASAMPFTLIPLTLIDTIGSTIREISEAQRLSREEYAQYQEEQGEFAGMSGTMLYDIWNDIAMAETSPVGGYDGRTQGEYLRDLMFGMMSFDGMGEIYGTEAPPWFEDLYNILSDDTTDRLDKLYEGWSYEGGFTDPHEAAEVMSLIRTDLSNLLRNGANKYTGEPGEATNLEAKVTVHSHLYMDGDQIMEVVNERTVGGFDWHVMG